MDHRRLVGAGVVEDQVAVQICLDVGIHMAQEAAKLHRVVSTVTFAQHLTRLHDQRGEEGGRAVPPVQDPLCIEKVRDIV